MEADTNATGQTWGTRKAGSRNDNMVAGLQLV
jgi:hypothetical protein